MLDYLIGAAIAFGLLALVLFIDGLVMVNDGRDESLNWHRLHGRYRVRYSDGQVSQPFSHAVAKDYAAMFGGEVIPR